MNRLDETTANQQDGTSPPDEPARFRLGELLAAPRDECHAIILHDYPDPDAIASVFAHRLISNQLHSQTDILYAGTISHSQNIALVRLLGVELVRYQPEYNWGQYQGAIYVDVWIWIDSICSPTYIHSFMYNVFTMHS